MVSVDILNYVLQFEPLTWRKEFAINIPKGSLVERVYLAHCLKEVIDKQTQSHLKISNYSEAYQILLAIPSALVYRIYKIFKSSLPPSIDFHTAGLYQAPTPKKFYKKFEEDEEERDEIADRAQRELKSKFSGKELKEAADLDKQILKASGLKGAKKVEIK